MTPQRTSSRFEEPVEITQEGIGQIEVNPKVQLTFATGLRAILRQDPNVVLVGEVRDKETADIAIQASLTGHLVLSTLHTNDAASALTRLVDMGVEPFLVGSSLVAVLAQRLVRVLCPHCREAYRASPEELEEMGVQPSDQPVTLHRATGCAECANTGYQGRLGIFELMVIDDENPRPTLQQHRLKDHQAAGRLEGHGDPPRRWNPKSFGRHHLPR